MSLVAERKPPGRVTHQRLLSLVGRSPDPDADLAMLRALAGGKGPVVRRFGETLHTTDRWGEQPMRELFPGLELVEPTWFWDRLGVRACNVLRRSGITTWQDICGASVAGIEAIRGAGQEVVVETLLAAAREWASAYLARWEPSEAHEENGAGPTIAPAREEGKPTGLDAAFARLESIPSFKTFELRELRRDRAPSYRAMEGETGQPRGSIAAQKARIDRHLEQQMRDPAWPIARAVQQLKERLGAVARPTELEQALSALHRETEALPGDLPQRRALLCHLAKYRVTEEWVLGPQVEKLTTAIIGAFAEEGSADVDAVSAHLASFGIREHLQLPWLASQSGYRILDGALVPVEH